MICLQLLCIIFGIGCAALETGSEAQECLTRSEFETRLKEMTMSHHKDISTLTDIHQEDIAILKYRVEQLMEINEVLEKKVQSLARTDKSRVTKEPINIITEDNAHSNVIDDHKPLRIRKDSEESVSVKKGKKPDRIRNVNRRYLVNEVTETPVAFSALISNTSGLAGLGKLQIIKFDKILTNFGNAFDIRLGVFTAPVSGIYAFTLTLMSLPNEVQQLNVMKDGVQIFHVYAYGTSQHDSASKTIVFEVRKGQEVWVQTTDIPGYSTKLHGFEHTSFTGFLLYTIDG